MNRRQRLEAEAGLTAVFDTIREDPELSARMDTVVYNATGAPIEFKSFEALFAFLRINGGQRS